MFDRLYDIAPASAIEAARANAQALGLDLAEAGISADCLPLLDVRQPGAHDVIGDRALGSEPLRRRPPASPHRAQLYRSLNSAVRHLPPNGYCPVIRACIVSILSW